MSSELIEEGAAMDTASDEVLLTNGANEADEGVAEYLEEHDPMAADKPEIPSKRGRKPRRPAETEEVEDENLQTLDDDEDGEVNEDALEDEDEVEEEDVKPVLRKSTQLPKKRKDVAVKVNSNRKSNDKSGYVDDDEQPTSTAREAAKMDMQVDEKQCRVCTSKDALISLFKATNKQTIADKLMIICPTVSIAQKDFMPQFICNSCFDNVNIALQLKTQCEATERELRKKLSRSKNKVRRPAGYVVVDATLDSDPSDNERNDDVEFKVSDEGGITAEDDSDDSDFGSPKKKRSPRAASGRRGRRKPVALTPAPKVKEKKRMGRRPIKRSRPSPSPSPPPPIKVEESSDEAEEPIRKQIKKKKIKSTPPAEEQEEKPTEFPCDECDQVFVRKLSLILHKKAHTQREPLKCEVCGQVFKIQGAYRKHVQKHNEEPSGFECTKCEYVGPSKAELRRHLVDEHDEQGVLHQCEKCKRKFVSEARLEKHKEGRCPGQERPLKVRHDVESYTVGKDLFKSVAPLTTTYWSDSFSD